MVVALPACVASTAAANLAWVLNFSLPPRRTTLQKTYLALSAYLNPSIVIASLLFVFYRYNPLSLQSMLIICFYMFYLVFIIIHSHSHYQHPYQHPD